MTSICSGCGYQIPTYVGHGGDCPEALRQRIAELETFIIEADACYNIDGIPGDIETACLALVTMCHHGAAALDQLANATCTWTQNDDQDSSLWHASCDMDWVFEESSPLEEDFSFCPKCGKRISIVVDAEESEDDR